MENFQKFNKQNTFAYVFAKCICKMFLYTWVHQQFRHSFSGATPMRPNLAHGSNYMAIIDENIPTTLSGRWSRRKKHRSECSAVQRSENSWRFLLPQLEMRNFWHLNPHECNKNSMADKLSETSVKIALSYEMLELWKQSGNLILSEILDTVKGFIYKTISIHKFFNFFS